MTLTGKRAVITGSTAGIGRAIADALLAEGAEVVLNGRDAATLAAAVDALRSRGCVHGVCADLSEQAGIDALIAEVRRHGAPDILVNNVNFGRFCDWRDTSASDWQRSYHLNVVAGYALVRAFADDMLARGWGRVVFMSSEAALHVDPEMLFYCAAKAGQLALSRGLAKQFRGTGVTVNAILPGPTWTDGIAAWFAAQSRAQGTPVDVLRERDLRETRPGSLIERWIQPDEVAAAVAFVCSPRADAITGAALRVDGGLVDTIA